MKITIQTKIDAPLEEIWQAWTTPDDIKKWNTASPDWHTTQATVDLRPGGIFSSRMEAKDGSFGFDFGGTYTKVEPFTLIESQLGDGRMILTEFIEEPDGILVKETFDTENAHSIEQQEQGWQAILDNFAQYVLQK